MDERFDREICKIHQLAKQEADRFNHDKINPLHLLLAIVKESQNTAGEKLRSHGIGIKETRVWIEESTQTIATEKQRESLSKFYFSPPIECSHDLHGSWNGLFVSRPIKPDTISSDEPDPPTIIDTENK